LGGDNLRDRDLFEDVGGPYKHESSRRRMEHAEWIDLAQDAGIWAGSCQYGNEPLNS
jgi:hypothetical protein